MIIPRLGAYYITVCTRDRECLFGDVVNGQMQLNEAGKIIQPVWEGLPHFDQGIELNAFIIMPNHVHGAIVIAMQVGAIHESPLSSIGKSPAIVARVSHRRRMLLAKLVCRSQNGYVKTDQCTTPIFRAASLATQLLRTRYP